MCYCLPSAVSAQGSEFLGRCGPLVDAQKRCAACRDPGRFVHHAFVARSICGAALRCTLPGTLRFRHWSAPFPSCVAHSQLQVAGDPQGRGGRSTRRWACGRRAEQAASPRSREQSNDDHRGVPIAGSVPLRLAPCGRGRSRAGERGGRQAPLGELHTYRSKRN